VGQMVRVTNKRILVVLVWFLTSGRKLVRCSDAIDGLLSTRYCGTSGKSFAIKRARYSPLWVGLRSAEQRLSGISGSRLTVSGGGQTVAKSSQSKAQQSKVPLPPVSAYNRPLTFFENMICGAISRSMAQTIMHPANTMKTILQSRTIQGQKQETFRRLIRVKNLKMLTRGAGAQLILSIPHGAVNFAVLEYVRRKMNGLVEAKFDGAAIGPGLDFVSSAISTVCCSIVSTPQMMITDNIMAGTYPNLAGAVSGLAKDKGIAGFYTGWWPGLAGKIPSYGLTWAFFQQIKRLQLQIMKREPKDIENSIMGCLAAATTVCIMIPMDTIKTRLVTQARYPHLTPYKGILDCAQRVSKEEGIVAFYRGLAPRLLSVVPMIGIQFGIYEFMKKAMLARNAALKADATAVQSEYELTTKSELEEVMMEVAADDEQPFPAPYFYEKKKLQQHPTQEKITKPFKQEKSKLKN